MARRTRRRIALAPAIHALSLLAALALSAVLALPSCAAPAPAPAPGGADGAATRHPAAYPPAASASASAAAAAAAAAHEEVSLAGEWTVWLDPGNVGVAQGWAEDLSAGRTPAGAPSPPVALAVPGPLEGSPSTRGYDGVAFFVREFSVPDDARHALLALRFGQVNWACRAWLDGAEIGAHEGGYDAFDLQLAGGAVPGVHRLVLRVVDPGATPVDGVTLKTTPHSKESWYENFGGLVGPVSLRIDRSARLTGAVVRVDDAASAVSLRGSVELSPSLIADGQLRIALEIAVDGVVRLRRDVPVHEGSADFDERIELPGATRWSPERPELHRVRVSVEDGRGRRDELLARDVGLRTVELRGGDLLVDGQRRVLKGVLWQPFFTGTGGVTPPDEELAAEARAIADTGFNLVRAHVRPAPPAFLDACDRLGLLVLEEPAIGWVDDDPALLPRLQHELDWMVARDGHHPSIILWGVLNELSGKAYRYADALVEHLAALDDSRPILEDSGGFFGDGRMLPPRAPAARLLPMVDRHAYPPYPLALEDRDELVHLGEGGDRPVFVSEFGYGTLTDCVTALAGFERRAPAGDERAVSDERVRYQTGAAVERRARQRGTTWTATDWRAAADRNEADAAEEMVEALRSNPALDLLCYTQWRAVSTECSAGVLAPWGEERPVRARLATALRPLLPLVLPARLSLRPGEPLTCTLAVVNDTGSTLDGTLALDVSPPARTASGGAPAGTASDAAPERTASDAAPAATESLPAPVRSFPPGVTRIDVTLPARTEAGALSLVATLRLAGGRVETSSARTVLVVAPAEAAAPAPVIWRAGDEPAALAAADAVLIARPEVLAVEASLDAQLALWRWVEGGGSAVVLLRNPGEAPLGDLLGMSRGVETLAALPVRADVASAPGNFMARLFVRRDAAGAPATPLGRDDALLSPRAMLVGDLPEGAEEHMLAVGHLGNRLGAPDATLPFGRGSVRFTGLPLRAAPGETLDPLRERVLAGLVADAARRTHEQRAHERANAPAASAPAANAPAANAPAANAPAANAPAANAASEPAANAPGEAELAPREIAPLTGAQRVAVQVRLQSLARLAAFGDRASPWLSGAGGSRQPAQLAPAFALHGRALRALIDGRADEAVALLDEALAAARWERGAQSFLALEAEVLDALSRRVAGQTLADWDACYDAAELWVSAIAAWFAAGDETADKVATDKVAADKVAADPVAAGTTAAGAVPSDAASGGDDVPGLAALRAARDRLARP